MRIILIGIQGSGKSTQGNLLSDKLKVPYLSTGHIFRVLSKEKTPLGAQIKVVINAGYLIPDEKTLKIVEDYLKRPEYENGYILDGFPRTVKQAKEFKDVPDKVFYIKISDKEALWRISGREGEIREDETLKAIRRRLDIFHKFTEPVLDFYKEKGILTEVDGEKTIEEVNKEILSGLTK